MDSDVEEVGFNPVLIELAPVSKEKFGMTAGFVSGVDFIESTADEFASVSVCNNDFDVPTEEELIAA